MAPRPQQPPQSPRPAAPSTSPPTPTPTSTPTPTGSNAPSVQQSPSTAAQSGASGPGANKQDGDKAGKEGGHGGAGGKEGGHGGGGEEEMEIPKKPDGSIDMSRVNPYIYKPSFSIAVTAASLYTIVAAIHLLQLIKTKAWFFAVMTQGATAMLIGMIARCHSIVTLKHTGATGPFVVSAIMDSAGPIMTAIGVIFCYTRTVWWVTPNQHRTTSTLLSPPKFISLTWSMLICLPDLGKIVGQFAFKSPFAPIGGQWAVTMQALQFLALSGFAMMTLRFMVISKSWVIHAEAESKNWRRFGWITCISAILLAFRHMFTVVQVDARSDIKGYWMRHEWIYWVTLQIPLFAVFVLYNFNHPAYFLPREYVGFKIDLNRIEKAKLEAAWPIRISPPVVRDLDFVQNDKGMEVRLTELEPGKRY